MKVKIYALDHNGRGIAKLDNKVIFIENALIDEVVEINITSDKKKFMTGEVINYIEVSKDRIKPSCKYYNECGGCDIMHIPYSKQLLYKESKVKDIMQKYSNISDDIVNPIISTNELNYRNKITLQVKEKLGLFKRNSYELVNIDQCLITDVRSNDIINKLNELDLANINQIVIRISRNSDQMMLVIDTINDINDELFINTFKDINIVIKKHNNYRVINGNDHIIDKIGEYEFIISPDSFFQVNTNGAKNLYDVVLNYVKDLDKPNILDLYCGTGTIGIYLSKYANKVLGIESNQYAIMDAKKNAKLNNISNINFKCGDVGTTLKQIDFKADLIVVDPPRAGLNSLAISEIKDIKAEHLIYVSCDPMTLARDLKELSSNYKVNAITPVDMFPNTYHVECVVKLTRI